MKRNGSGGIGFAIGTMFGLAVESGAWHWAGVIFAFALIYATIRMFQEVG